MTYFPSRKKDPVEDELREKFNLIRCYWCLGYFDQGDYPPDPVRYNPLEIDDDDFGCLHRSVRQYQTGYSEKKTSWFKRTFKFLF